MGRPQISGRKADAICRAWRQVLHKHIGARDQARHDLPRLGALEIERDRLLRPVEPDEMAGEAANGRVVAAREIARARALALDHARAELSELPGCERHGHGLFDGDYGDSVKWQHAVRRTIAQQL